MTPIIADQRDIDFVLYEQLEIESLCKHDKFKEFEKKTIDLTIKEVRKFAIKELLPTRVPGDREGCKFENGKVTVPECFHQAYELFNQGEWLGLSEDPEWGGQGMPQILSAAAREYLVGCNSAFMMFPGLTWGAAKVIETFGTDEQKKLFVKNLYSGKWTGAMLITEPDVGSDLALTATEAVKNQDGTYSIIGSKIFISSGEHDLTENKIYLVLARIQGAPAGVSGVSMFIVPNIWINQDGGLGDFNNVVCTGIERKMGLNGSSTCALSLGEKGICKGMLLKNPNEGIQYFSFWINESRGKMLAAQNLSYASSAYLYALSHAKQCKRGRNLLKVFEGKAPSVPIIQHPDVRRQLMLMKVYVEGIRSLVYYIALCFDRSDTNDDPEEKNRRQNFIKILTPIVKAYSSERAFEVCNHAIQIFGGHGYTKDYPAEQILRDCRITMIYEGANGIMAMEHLVNHLQTKNEKVIQELFAEIQKVINFTKETAIIADLADRMKNATELMNEVILHMQKNAFSTKIMTTYAFAHPFMEVYGDVIMAWMLLWRASIAASELEKTVQSADLAKIKEIVQNDKRVAFYYGQIQSAKFFSNVILPTTLGKMKAILAMDDSVADIPETCF